MAFSLMTLLLLPDPPLNATFNDVKVAFHPPLLSAMGYSKRSRLVVALPISEYVQEFRPFTDLFDQLRNLLANMYTLVVTILEVDLAHQHETNEADVCVALVYDQFPTLDPSTSVNLAWGAISLEALASSGAPWAQIFVVQSEPGEEIYSSFDRHLHRDINTSIKSQGPVRRVPGGLRMRISDLGEVKAMPIQDKSSRSGTNDVIMVIDHHDLDLTAKYILNVGLIFIQALATDDIAPNRFARRKMHIVLGGAESKSHEVKSGLVSSICAFLMGVTDFDRLDHLEVDKSWTLSSSKRSLNLEGHIITMEDMKDDQTRSATEIITSQAQSLDLTAINAVRRGKGWTELSVVALTKIKAAQDHW